jgi:hypothetical protein
MMRRSNVCNEIGSIDYSVCPFYPDTPVEVTCAQQGNIANAVVASRDMPHGNAIG